MPNKSKNVALTIRLDKDLLKSFQAVCQHKDYSQSFVVRELIKRYIKDNKQVDLFN